LKFARPTPVSHRRGTGRSRNRPEAGSDRDGSGLVPLPTAEKCVFVEESCRVGAGRLIVINALSAFCPCRPTPKSSLFWHSWQRTGSGTQAHGLSLQNWVFHRAIAPPDRSRRGRGCGCRQRRSAPLTVNRADRTAAVPMAALTLRTSTQRHNDAPDIAGRGSVSAIEPRGWGSSNGRTAASDPARLGSNPSPPAKSHFSPVWPCDPPHRLTHRRPGPREARQSPAIPPRVPPSARSARNRGSPASGRSACAAKRHLSRPSRSRNV
jgi:hypothetical protein